MHHVVTLLFALYYAPLMNMDPENQKISPFPKVFRQDYNFEYLLSGNGNTIRRIINEDPVANIITITTIETNLKTGLENNNYKSLHDIYGEDLLQFVRCIAYRHEDCKRWHTDIEIKHFNQAATILKRNPYIANYLFLEPGYCIYDKTLTTPLHWILDEAAKNTDFRDNHSYSILKTLLEAGADANGIGADKNGNTPLHKASLVSHIELLWQFGARTETKNKGGQTPLMRLYLMEKRRLSDFLIGACADLNAQDIYGNTLLHYAIDKKEYESCKNFLMLQASFMIPNKEGKTAACYTKDIPKLRKKIEPYMQRFLCKLLSCHNFKLAKNSCSCIPG